MPGENNNNNNNNNNNKKDIYQKARHPNRTLRVHVRFRIPPGFVESTFDSVYSTLVWGEGWGLAAGAGRGDVKDDDTFMIFSPFFVGGVESVFAEETLLS